MLGGACANGPVGGIPPGTGWRVVPGADLPCRHWPDGESSASINDVVALGPADVWTAGLCVVGKTTTAVISHWNGRRWGSQRLPAAAGPARPYLIAGTADDDMWAVSGLTTSPLTANVAFRWDGSQWKNQSQGLPGYQFDVIAASAAAGTWAIVNVPGASYGTALVHWDGGRWQQVAFPPLFGTNSPPDQLAVGPGDSVWIAGTIGNSGNSVPGLGAPLAARYDGHAWRYYRLPRTTSKGGLVTGFVVAGQTTWALVINNFTASADYELVPLTGGTASQLKIPSDHLPPAPIAAIAGEPRSGLYLLRRSEPAVQHWDGHAWHVEPFPAPRHVYAYRGDGCSPVDSTGVERGGRVGLNGLDISAMSSVPGTGTVWAAGSFGRGGAPGYPDCPQPTTQPVVEVYGPVPQH